MRELILGGQKSGKSRRAEALAAAWLAQDSGHRAVLLATAQAGDAQMTARIARHQQDRALRVPAMQTHEVPLDLAQALGPYNRADTLVVVDCLTLWLTNWTMPLVAGQNQNEAGQSEPEQGQTLAQRTTTAQQWQAQCDLFLAALTTFAGRIVLVGNEIGCGVIPMGEQVRHFVDALGVLNQSVAQRCETVTLMIAGLPLQVR